MKALLFEKNFILLAIGAFAVFAVGATLTTIVPPLVDEDLVEKREGLHEYSEAELRGRKVYQSEGCVYCHTQQIRNNRSGTDDNIRYGWRLVKAPPSEAWEYANDAPHFLGTKRTGPDLARVGGKYSSEWHWAHFKNPRDMGEKFYEGEGNVRVASLMPGFSYLTDKQIKDITAYLQTLGRNIDWRLDKDGNPLNDYEE
jgi:cytochrome c oxidase cbb3-type subunit 2